jgi:hypothetical protein
MEELTMNPQVPTPETARTEEAPIAQSATTERFRMTGEEMIARVKNIVHEGNVRRVLIKNPEGHIIVEFPLTVGVVGAALAPMWAAVGAVVAIVSECTIEVEKLDKPL